MGGSGEQGWISVPRNSFGSAKETRKGDSVQMKRLELVKKIPKRALQVVHTYSRKNSDKSSEVATKAASAASDSDDEFVDTSAKKKRERRKTGDEHEECTPLNERGNAESGEGTTRGRLDRECKVFFHYDWSILLIAIFVFNEGHPNIFPLSSLLTYSSVWNQMYSTKSHMSFSPRIGISRLKSLISRMV